MNAIHYVTLMVYHNRCPWTTIHDYIKSFIKLHKITAAALPLRKHEVKQWLAFNIHLQQFLQGENSPDNVKFPDNSMTFPWQFVALLPMLSVTHTMPVLVLLSVVGVGMQQCMIQNQSQMQKLSKVMDTNMQLTINSFRPLLPNKIFSLTFPWQLSNSRFSRQVVTLFFNDNKILDKF